MIFLLLLAFNKVLIIIIIIISAIRRPPAKLRASGPPGIDTRTPQTVYRAGNAAYIETRQPPRSLRLPRHFSRSAVVHA